MGSEVLYLQLLHAIRDYFSLHTPEAINNGFEPNFNLLEQLFTKLSHWTQY